MGRRAGAWGRTVTNVRHPQQRLRLRSGQPPRDTAPSGPVGFAVVLLRSAYGKPQLSVAFGWEYPIVRDQLPQHLMLTRHGLLEHELYQLRFARRVERCCERASEVGVFDAVKSEGANALASSCVIDVCGASGRDHDVPVTITGSTSASVLSANRDVRLTGIPSADADKHSLKFSFPRQQLVLFGHDPELFVHDPELAKHQFHLITNNHQCDERNQHANERPISIENHNVRRSWNGGRRK